MFDTGNLSLLKSAVVGDKVPVSLRADTTIAAAATGDGDGDAVVMVNGALVNVSSVLQNLSKSEEERAQTETELKNKEQECGVYHLVVVCCLEFSYNKSLCIQK